MNDSEQKPGRWVVEGALFPLQLAIGANFFAPAPLFPLIMDDFDLSRATVSLLVAVVTIMLAAITIPASFFASRIGLKAALTGASLLMSAGALAPFASDFLTLVGLRVLFGISVGIALPVSSAIVVQWFGPRQLPMVNGLNLTGQSVGVALSMFTAAPLAELSGWELPLFLYGSIAFVGVVVWTILGREPEGDGRPPMRPSWGDLTEVLRSRTTLILQLAVAGSFAFYTGISSWLPSYYHEVREMSLDKASAITALLPLVGIAATLIGGVASTRMGLRRPFLIVPGVLMGICALGAILFSNEVLIIGAVIMVGLWSWIYLPALFTIPMEIAGMSPQKVAITIAAVLAAGDFIAFLAPIAVGLATDLTGSYLPGLTALSAVSATLLIAGLLLPETGTRVSSRRAPEVAPSNAPLARPHSPRDGDPSSNA